MQATGARARRFVAGVRSRYFDFGLQLHDGMLPQRGKRRYLCMASVDSVC